MIIKIEIEPRGKSDFNHYHLSEIEEEKLRSKFEKTDFYYHHNGFNKRSAFGNYLDEGKQSRWIGFMMAQLECFE